MEDLNLERNVFKIVEYCWYNKKRFNTIEDIASVTKISTRTITRIAYNNNLPFRQTIHKDATDKESAQARTKV
jgi:predicted transcriptional regulator